MLEKFTKTFVRLYVLSYRSDWDKESQLYCSSNAEALLLAGLKYKDEVLRLSPAEEFAEDRLPENIIEDARSWAESNLIHKEFIKRF